MKKKVIGSFATEEEVAVNTKELELSGYKAEDLTLLSGKENAEELENQTDIQVESGMSGEEAEESFMDKVKRAFTQDVGPEDTLNTHDKLISYGLSEEQASEYARGVEAGNILLVADDNEIDGTTPPVADDNLDSLDRTGRTNITDENLASESDNQNIIADNTEPESSETENKRDSSDEQGENGTERKEKTKEETLEENPVLNKSTQERKGRSI